MPAYRCGAPAKLQCPKCLELQLSRAISVFCSQDCFKVSDCFCWVVGSGSCKQERAKQSARSQYLRQLMQAAWVEHKKQHSPAPDAWLYCVKRGKARSLVMPDCDWSGPLRPGKISPARVVRTGKTVLCCGKRADFLLFWYLQIPPQIRKV